LAPECVFISAEPVQRTVRQIGEAQKALGKETAVAGRFFGPRLELDQKICPICRRLRLVAAVAVNNSRSEKCIDRPSRGGLKFARLPEPPQMVGLNFK
jgi:hypothetical protein